MIVKEVQDIHEFEVEGLRESFHVIYEKVCEMEPKFDNNNQLIATVECDTYEEISVFEETESLIRKATYRIGTDVNTTSEALNIIAHTFGCKLSA